MRAPRPEDGWSSRHGELRNASRDASSSALALRPVRRRAMAAADAATAEDDDDDDDDDENLGEMLRLHLRWPGCLGLVTSRASPPPPG